MSSLEIGKHYNLAVHANSILGSNFSNVLVKAILDYNLAIKFGSVDLLHKQVYPYLPASTPSDHTKYNYYLVEHRDKQIVLAEYWIVNGSVELTSGNSVTFKLNNVTSNQVTTVRDQLRLLGISFEIT